MEKIQHVIQSCITSTADKHVCCRCGSDAHLLLTGYEVATQAQIDEMMRTLPRTNVQEAMRFANASPLSEIIYQATLAEQQKGPPQEHSYLYYCPSCLSIILDGATGIPGSGNIMLSQLTGAIWVVCNKKTGMISLMNTPFQDVTLVLAALQYEQRLPRIRKK